MPAVAWTAESVPDEGQGLDISAHGEEAYLHSDGGGGRSTLSAIESAPSQRRVDNLVSAPVSK